jgi:predicted RNA binding protein YcfA (HicA-like mRNA interferase family)
MTGIEKLIEKFLNDKTHITVEDCDRLLTGYGYSLHKKGGSHKSYHKKDAISITVITPKNTRYVKLAYVELVIKYLKLGE